MRPEQRAEARWLARAARVERRLGVPEAEQRSVIEFQGWVCAVCGLKEQPGKTLHADHQHDGRRLFRGYLCKRCNEKAEAFEAYFTNPPAVQAGVEFEVPALLHAAIERKREADRGRRRRARAGQAPPPPAEPGARTTDHYGGGTTRAAIERLEQGA
jgi:hypothetical protein